ncbi:MAG: hypothetical protein KatS3mg110_1982 [Pirellulaceae bacterium]|nr:MAG: hypothetical protein KatS3mg110_1982 [Pirellulaceae bacterium]
MALSRPLSLPGPTKLVGLAFLVSVLLSGNAEGETGLPSGVPWPLPPNSWTPTGVLREVLIKTLPEQYQNDKHWGKQRPVERWRWTRSDGPLRLEKVTVPVNHGSWWRYEVRLVDPERELEVWLDNPRLTPRGTFLVDGTARARLELFGRLSEWLYGVQLISVNAVADARVTVRATWEVALDWQAGTGLPRWAVRADQVKCNVDEFRVVRVSQAHGPLVKKAGPLMRDWLNRRLDEQQERIRDRINQQLEKGRRPQPPGEAISSPPSDRPPPFDRRQGVDYNGKEELAEPLPAEPKRPLQEGAVNRVRP